MLPAQARAETHISDETVFSQNIYWTKGDGPYILDGDIFLPPYLNIYIGPGTIIESSADTRHYLYIRNSNVRIDGSATEPVIIKGLSEVNLVNSTSTLVHTKITVPLGLFIFAGTTTVSSSVISGAEMGISAHKAIVGIVDSTITGNSYGIYSFYEPAGPVLSHLESTWGLSQNTGGEGNLFGDDLDQNHISISSSTIEGNSISGIYNDTSNTIIARNNWWGSDAGPRPTDIHGPVDVVPWVQKAIVVAPACCSSVLFIPGIEASRLYRGEKGMLGGIFGTSTNQLWEPNRNADVAKLFMDSAGKSLDPTIYAKGVIDSVFGFSIYKNLMSMLQALVTDGKIKSWQVFPYDWRLSIEDVVTPTLITAIQTLASSSKTSRVTIVAHSNGGLVAKMLMKKLQDQRKADLVDKVVLVAVPELGTPQAVAGLLHGDGEDIAGGFILNKTTARQLGENMPGGYGLLPSLDYFIGSMTATSTPTPSLFGPVVSFARSMMAGLDFSGYQVIQNKPTSALAYDAFRAFLSGAFDHRTAPLARDILSPLLLHSSIFDSAKHVHDTIDDFVFPSSTRAVSLIGWGKKTIDGVTYSERSLCGHPDIPGVFAPCQKALTYSATTTKAGDGTVVAASAASADSQNYYLNISSSKADHSTIFNHDSALTFVKDEITSSGTTSAVVGDPLLSIPNITNHFPTAADLASDDLVVTTHSPVTLGIYDSQGRYTGQIPNPDPTSDLGRYVVNIPGSDFRSNPDEGYNITVPYQDTYRVVLNGIGVGTFTLDTEHNVNGRIIAATTFADMPVTPLLTAELDLAPTIATSSQVLRIDSDGDGSVDATSSPHGPVDYSSSQLAKNKYMKEYFQSIRSSILTLHLPPLKEKRIITKVDKLLELLKNKKMVKAAISAEHVADGIAGQHWIYRKLDDTKRQALADTLDHILGSMSEDK
ncbi:MAG: hypothetical protein WCQ60_01570 [bacterium]